MPYKRKSSKRRVTKKAVSWRKHAGTALSLASRAGIKALKMKLGLNTENKNWDISSGGASSGTIATHMNPLIGLAQGNTNTTRTGNGGRITHWSLKGYWANNVLNSAQQQVRVIITLQKEVVSTTSGVSAAQLLQTTTDINSPYNTDLTDVKVLYDKISIVKPNFSGQIAYNRFKYKWSPSYDDGHFSWTDADTTGAVANQLKGVIKCFIMTDQASNFPIFTTYSRVHFVDN